MEDYEILKDKRILVVDDEPDILDLINEQLPDSEVITAQNYVSAHSLITTGTFDLVILDIMGVNGFALLEACQQRKLPATMLTAHAVNAESLKLARKLGAVSFLPKEELSRLPEILAEILEGLAQGKDHWPKLFERLGPFFKEKLQVVWEDIEKTPYPPTYY